MRQFLNIDPGIEAWLGYRELGDALGRRTIDGDICPVSRSTIERMVRDSILPPPQKMRGRSVWAASEIERLLQDRVSQQVQRSAVTNTDDLSPDEIEYQVRIYAAEALSSHIGHPVDPKALDLRATRPLTEDEFTVLEKESHRILADYLSRLTVDQALTVGQCPVLC